MIVDALGRSQASRALGALLVAVILTGCPPPLRRIEPPPATIDVPRPSETDLRDLSRDQRRSFLDALADLEGGKVKRSLKDLRSLEEDVSDSPSLSAAIALAELASGSIASPLQRLRGMASRATHSRFVQLCYASAAEMASDFDAALHAVEAARALAAGDEDPERIEELRVRAARLRSEAAQVHRAKARILEEDGDLAGATIEMEAALAARGDDPELQADLGALYLRGGHFAKADELLTLASQVNDSDRVRRRLATARLKNGRFEDAKRLFTELLALDPTDAEAREGLEAARAEIRRQGLPARFKDLKSMPTVHRAELAALLLEAIPSLRGLPPVVKGVVVTDISGSWAKEYVLMAVSLGLLDVYEDHTFGAEERVTRADFADALARTLGRIEHRPGDLTPEQAYPVGAIEDLPRGHGRFHSIIRTLNYGLMELSEGRIFRPADPVTGREAVAAVERLAVLDSEVH